MYGAILGDMIGAPYEFDQGDKSKDFRMWNMKVHFTDDSVMTIAVAEALMDAGSDAGIKKRMRAIVRIRFCGQDLESRGVFILCSRSRLPDSAPGTPPRPGAAAGR